MPQIKSMENANFVVNYLENMIFILAFRFLFVIFIRQFHSARSNLI